MQYRLAVSASGDSHMGKYIKAIDLSKKMQDNRGFYHFAGLHGVPENLCWHHQFSNQSNLTARLFLPWHRAYLHRLEQSLQDSILDVAIPWWNWAKTQDIPSAFSSPKFGTQAHPLFNSQITLNQPIVTNPINRITMRNLGSEFPASSFPSADTNKDGRATLEEFVDRLINSESRFVEFNDSLEHIHDLIHGYVGGDMGSILYAAYDPIFYSHHAMIDRIWALWQQQHGTDNFPTELKNTVLEPFGLTVADVLNTQSLGYEYANTVAELAINEFVVLEADGG